MTAPRTFVLIVAAGSGQRFGGALPKQYQDLAGKPLLRHCLETFAAHPGITGIQVAINPDHRDLYDQATRGLPHLLAPIPGGASRQDSVLNGLEHLAGHKPDLVLIHDAARPLVDAGIITRTIEALGKHHAVLVAGLVQLNSFVRDPVKCDMKIEELSSGVVLQLSEDRGKESRGCRLDTNILAEAAAQLSRALDRRPDVLVLNKFGKTEAEGRGVRDVLARAVGQGIPPLFAP